MMKKLIKNQLFVISLLLLQTVSLFSAVEAQVQRPAIVYKPMATEVEAKSAQLKAQAVAEKIQANTVKAHIAPKILPGSKDDSFLPSSKPVIAQEYKQRSLTLEDHPKDITELGSDVPMAVAEPIDDDFADSGLLEYSGLTHVQAEPIHAMAMAKVHAVTGLESYNAQGQVARKDFVDAQGNKHAITYDEGVEAEMIFDKDGHKAKQIITQADKISVVRLYAYDNVSKKDVLQSIETKLPDGTSVFKHVYSGKLIDAQVRNKVGEVEGETYRDDFDNITTIIHHNDGTSTSSIRYPEVINHNDDGTITIITHDTERNEIAITKDVTGRVVLKVTTFRNRTKEREAYNVDGSSEITFYNIYGKITRKDQYNSDGSSESLSYNADGKISHKSIQKVDGSSEITFYDIDGKITRKDQYNSDGSSESLSYNADGKISYKSIQKVDGSSESLYYNVDGKLTQKTISNGLNVDGIVDNLITHHTYYNETTGKITGSGKTVTSHDYSTHHTTTYDVDGNIESEYIADQGISFEDIDYHNTGKIKSKKLYDNDGNLISKENYDVAGTLRYQLKLNSDKTKQEEKRYDATGKLIYDLNAPRPQDEAMQKEINKKYAYLNMPQFADIKKKIQQGSKLNSQSNIVDID